jgi:hypothetical protein
MVFKLFETITGYIDGYPHKPETSPKVPLGLSEAKRQDFGFVRRGGQTDSAPVRPVEFAGAAA